MYVSRGAPFENVPAKNQRIIVYPRRVCQVLFPTATLQTYCRSDLRIATSREPEEIAIPVR